MAPLAAYDPTRAAELFRLLAYRVQMTLRREYPRADPQRVADAVVDAVMSLATTDQTVTDGALYQIARSGLRTHYRSEVRRQKREKRLADLLAEAVPKPPTVLEEIAERELYSRWRVRLVRSDAEKVVLDNWLGGLSSAAGLARHTGLSEKAVRTILNRFRQRLLRERQRGEDER